VDGNDVVDTFNRGEKFCFEIDGTKVELEKDDTLIAPAQKSGYAVKEENGMTVVLDTAITEELLEKGFVRELVSKIQTMRKDADFDVTDRIAVVIKTTDKLAAVAEKNKDAIMQTVLATSLEMGEGCADMISKDWDINGEAAVISVKKA